jgi:PPOX class probable F420-dependent enzyme
MTAARVEEVLRELAGPGHLAVLSTLLPDGRPQTHVVWVSYEDGQLLVNTEKHRQKHRNVRRDPRVTVLLVDGRDPHRFVEVRGDVVAVVDGRPAREHVDALSRAYRGRPYDASIRSERVVLRIAPRRCIAVEGASYRTLTIGPDGSVDRSAALPE